MYSVATIMGCEEGDSANIIVFKTAVRDSIIRWCDLDGIEPNLPLLIATALDPHFKALNFLNDDVKRKY